MGAKLDESLAFLGSISTNLVESNYEEDPRDLSQVQQESIGRYVPRTLAALGLQKRKT